VDSDEPTLVEPFETELLRASFAASSQNAAFLLEAFHAPVARHRVLALRGLVRQSLMSDDLWREGLDDEDVDVRRDTLQQLAHVELANPDLLDDVLAKLDDPDDLVVDAAAFALGEHLYVKAVEPLCRIAREHADARCRESSIASLGAIGDDRARETIIAALRDKPPVRRRAIVALANFEGPDIEAALDTASEDRDWQVRSAVTQLRNEED
jgi:HEAT repeat protein